MTKTYEDKTLNFMNSKHFPTLEMLLSVFNASKHSNIIKFKESSLSKFLTYKDYFFHLIEHGKPLTIREV